MKRFFLIVMTLCSMLQAADEPVAVALSGTVKDNTGKPIEGVKVLLAHMNNVSTETNAAGAFTLTNATSVLLPRNHNVSFGLLLKNNAIVFTTGSEKTTGTISLYSGNGRVIYSSNLNTLSTGQQNVTLPELSSGIYLLAGTVDGESFTRSLVYSGNNLYLQNETIGANRNRSFTLGKKTATAIDDTLILSKEGYDTTNYPLTNYSKDDIEIIMTEEGGDEFTITSIKFSEGDQMPDEYTCEGKSMGSEIAPPLQWVNPPQGTKSYALFFKDLTLAEQSNPNGYHWGMWNIPVTITGMPEGLGGDQFPSEMGGAQQKGALGNKFFGPCPDYGKTGTTDTYAFTLFAFDEETIAPPTNLQQMDTFFEENAIAKTSISVWSDAAPQ